MINGQSAGKNYAYVLGVFLGDGCVSMMGRNNDRPSFRLNSIDEDFVAKVKESLSDLSKYTATTGSYPVPKSSKPNHYLTCGDKDLCEILVADTHGKKVIPEYVFGWDKENKIAFIAGLMDSEGFVAENKSRQTLTNRRFCLGFKSCDVWVPDFIRILESVGVKIGKVSQEVPRKPWYKVPTRFSIKMRSWIDSGCYFNIARKQCRVDEWDSLDAYCMRPVNPRRLTSETICHEPC